MVADKQLYSVSESLNLNVLSYHSYYSSETITLGFVMTSIVSNCRRKWGGICVHTAYLIHPSAPRNIDTPPPTTTMQLYMRFLTSSESEN